MKKFFTNITSIFHKSKKHEAWYGVKYLLVKSYKVYNVPHDLGDEPFYPCEEFHTKEDAFKYLEEYVSKSDKKMCRLYKEIKL